MFFSIKYCYNFVLCLFCYDERVLEIYEVRVIEFSLCTPDFENKGTGSIGES
jgi:hypothetical protein